jgi:hypothetical protein
MLPGRAAQTVPALGSVLWNPPAAALGAHNALISDTGAKRLEPFVGPLSLKHMLGGGAIWSANGRRLRVEGDAFLVLNHGTGRTSRSLRRSSWVR